MSDGNLEVCRLTLPGKFEGVSIPRRRMPPRVRLGGRFLRGPIPMAWLNQAGSLPGKALHVGISIWHWHFIKKGASPIALSVRKLEEIGVKRSSAYRALAALEEAGLISVIRHVGRNPRVTLKEAT